MKASVLSFLLFSSLAIAGPKSAIDSPVIVIGASYESGNTPCVLGKVNVLGCISVDFGEYLSLGQALTRSPLTSGSVFVEALGGATTFDRPGFIIPSGQQAEVGWEEHGYSKQLQRGLLATTNPVTGQVNSKHVVIGMPNDCLHSNAFPVAPSQASPCTAAERDAVVDRFIAVGQQAQAAGLTPVFEGYPPLKSPGSKIGVDFALAQQALGFLFVISDADYQDLVSRFNTRIAAELPGAILSNAWSRIVVGPDGLHPDRKSVEAATTKVAVSILRSSR